MGLLKEKKKKECDGLRKILIHIRYLHYTKTYMLIEQPSRDVVGLVSDRPKIHRFWRI